MKPLFDDVLLWLLLCSPFAIRNDAVTIEDLNQKLIDLHQQSVDIENLAEAEGRELSEEEGEQIDKITAEFENTEKILSRREKIDAQSVNLNARLKGPGRQSLPDPQASGGSDVSSEGRQFRRPIDPVDKGQWGFKTFGQYALAVKAGSGKGATPDPRLIKNAPTTFGQEGVGADGGFTVPPDFREEIKDLIFTDDSLIGMTDQMTTTSNNITLPVDENAAWDSTDGVQCYWENEAGQISQSKPNIVEKSIKLNKLTALVPVTEELVADSSSIDSYLRKKVPEKMDAKVNTAFVNGTGAGVPLGILNAPATLSVAKESGQGADTVVYENIVNMWARMPHANRRNAVWLINQDIEPQLDTMSFEGTSSSVPVYLPANGISAAPYASLKGRPVLPIQACQTLGDVGDIILADMHQYMSVLKTGGVRTDVSMHLYFDYDMLAFRFILRVAGQPWLASAITPENGSNTLSPFVTLAERA